MSPLFEFAIRMSFFMFIFLVISFFLYRHIQKVKNKKGMPKESKNSMSIFAHFFELPQKRTKQEREKIYNTSSKHTPSSKPKKQYKKATK